jgi:hypothetical protein
MTTFHHKPIKRFGLEGVIHDDALIGRLKFEYIRLVDAEMRIAGYAPRLDIDPDFTIRYNEKKKYFEFTLSLYGIYVGRKKVEWILGVDGNTAIPTQKSKSNVFSQEQA